MTAGLDLIDEPAGSERRKAVLALEEHLKVTAKTELFLPEGAMLFLDNERVLHGREGFTGPRHLRRIWMG